MWLKELVIKDTKGARPWAVFTSERALHLFYSQRETEIGIIQTGESFAIKVK